jgi:5-methylcytosine-specific restriction endonuclease McrA
MTRSGKPAPHGKGWNGQGSTTAWERVRKVVLARDSYTCRIKLPGCTIVARCVHHTIGKQHGDDPAWLVAACTHCNLSIGEPKADPAPMRAMTAW